MAASALLFFLAGASTFETSFRTGLIALQHNELSAAQSNLEAAAKLAPENGKVWAALAQTYWKLHEGGKAEEAAAKAASLSPRDPLVLHSLGVYYSETNQPLKAIEVDPAVESYYFDAARAFLAEEKFSAAVKVLEAGKSQFPKSAQIALTLGVAYYGLRRFEDAATAFLETIRLAPDTEQPYSFLGKMLDQIPDRLPEATKRFVEFERANPSSYLGYLLHAKALDAQSLQPDAAEQLLAKAIALNDSDATAHFELGTLLERKRRFADAARAFERAVALDPRDPVAHYRLSRVYDRLGKPEAAQAEREQHARLVAAQDAGR